MIDGPERNILEQNSQLIVGKRVVLISRAKACHPCWNVGCSGAGRKITYTGAIPAARNIGMELKACFDIGGKVPRMRRISEGGMLLHPFIEELKSMYTQKSRDSSINQRKVKK